MVQLLKKLFSVRNYGHDLENFINSKRPTNNAEVEYWTRWYEAHGVCRGL